MQRKIFYSSLLLLSLLGNTAIAHNVKTNVDVGVTFHIEPDHSPSVGKKSRAWFALTRKGGKLIPLAECDCDLQVYLESQNKSPNDPILNPPLIPISPEKYQNIPGANLIFPQPGIYQLELTGKPVKEGDFTPFQVTYPVTVKPSINATEKLEKQTSQANQTEEEPAVTSDLEQANINRETSSEDRGNIYPWLISIVVGGLAVIGVAKMLQATKK